MINGITCHDVVGLTVEPLDDPRVASIHVHTLDPYTQGRDQGHRLWLGISCIHTRQIRTRPLSVGELCDMTPHRTALTASEVVAVILHRERDDLYRLSIHDGPGGVFHVAMHFDVISEAREVCRQLAELCERRPRLLETVTRKPAATA